MPLLPSQDLPLATHLRAVIARLRPAACGAVADTSAPETVGAVTTTTQEGVPLVLPFDPERLLIPRLLRRLRRGRFLRQFPDSLAEYAPLTEDAACYLIDKLHTVRVDRWQEGVAAVWTLGRLTADDPARTEAAELLTWLIGPRSESLARVDRQRLVKRIGATQRNMVVGVTLAWSGAELYFGGSASARQPSPIEIIFTLAVGALLLAVPVAVLSFVPGFPLDVQRMSRIRSMAILTLARWRDPQHLALILRQYVEKRGRIRSAAEAALTEVLPLLNVGEHGECAADFVPNLCRALERKERQVLGYTARDETLEERLVEALGKVGDGRALPIIERIARRGRTRRLQELAQDVLPLVQARSRQTNDLKQLLRGATQPDPAPGTLLRPAREISTPAGQLLRPQPTSSDPGPVQVQQNVS